MKDKTKFLFGTACFFGGVIAGFLVSPVKKGVCIINNGGFKCKNTMGDLKSLGIHESGTTEENNQEDVQADVDKNVFNEDDNEIVDVEENKSNDREEAGKEENKINDFQEADKEENKLTNDEKADTEQDK